MPERFHQIRRKIHATYYGTQGWPCKLYDALMVLCILLSLAPLAIQEPGSVWRLIEQITAALFIFDYLARFCNADLALQKGRWSWLLYPITPMALIDLLSILSLLTLGLPTFVPLWVQKAARLGRVCRAVKLCRYSRSLRTIGNVFRAQRGPLLAMVWIAVGYIMLSALLVYTAEPATFGSYFNAIYWSTITLTTVGYGDFAPTTDLAKLITILSALVGVAVVALPAGIITAGYMDALQKRRKNPGTDGEEDRLKK